MSADFSVDPKITQMAVRMHRLGMACPSEQLLKRAGAILVVCHAPDAASPDDKRTWCKRIQGAIKSRDSVQAYPHSHLKLYPPNPSYLTDAMLAHAYDQGDTPVACPIDMSSLISAMSGIGYRSTHKSLKPTPTAPLQLDLHQRQQPNAQMDPAMQMMQFLGTAMQHMFQGAAPHADTARGDANVQLLGMKPNRRGSVAAFALPVPSP
eukprot:3304744-Pyramimonas_sp.AAC.1